MRSQRFWLTGLCLLLATAHQMPRADEPPKQQTSTPEVAQAWRALAVKIDQHLAARWESDKVQPAPLADDAEFLRRVYLDLTGRIPPVSVVRDFLESNAPDKRQEMVAQLLDSPAYVNHFTNVWRTAMLPEANAGLEARFLVPSFEGWLRKQLAENVAYDQMARELLTVRLDNYQSAFQGGAGEPSPVAFYQIKEAKPENLAGSMSRLFLGVRLECAQCHNHPFAKWKREQFWSFAAFFAGLQRQGDQNVLQPIREVADKREITIPGTERVVQAAFLDESEPQWKFKVTPRVTLSEWVTSGDNPFFARAAVNRLWGHFLGIGIVDPVDDLEGENPASHPELLDELAKEFVAQKFDLKFLIRAITASRAYQLSSAGTNPKEELQFFARKAVRGMSGEQIFDSFAQATGYREDTPQDPRTAFLLNSARTDFLAKFSDQLDKPTEFQSSILQALLLMNGKLVADATSLDSKTLAAVVDSPFMDTGQRIETLFLATLTRKPRPEEKARLVSYVDSGGPKSDPKLALGDVFWALLNSGEFVLNH